MSEKMFTVREAAAYLGITRQSMYKIINNRKIEYQKIGYIKIAERHLNEYRANEERDNEGMMSVKEAAAYLGVSKQEMYKIVRRGAIEAKKAGRIKIPENALIKYRENKTYMIEQMLQGIRI